MGAQHWNELTRDELTALLPDAVVVLPTAATEQHGPHLPTGHDTFAVNEIARRAAQAATDVEIVLAPVLAFGSSAHHLPFGGTLSLSTETYYRVVRELVEAAIRAGARRVLLLNGHGGNHELNQLVARDVTLAPPDGRDVTIGAASYWDIAREALEALPELAGVRWPGHAGQFETATMLAMRPEHVREPRPARDTDPSKAPPIPGARVERTGAWQAYDGFTDFPARAIAEQGKAALETIVREVASALTAFATT